MPGRLAFRDATGTLTGEDTTVTADEPTDEITRYAGALCRYEAGVNRRYGSFLDEFAPGEQEDLHSLVLCSVISGETGPLSGWLDDRHGPGTFAGLFRTPEYFAPGVTV